MFLTELFFLFEKSFFDIITKCRRWFVFIEKFYSAGLKLLRMNDCICYLYTIANLPRNTFRTYFYVHIGCDTVTF